MSNFYTNFTVYETHISRIIKALRKMEREAYLIQPDDRYAVVYDMECDSQDETAILACGSDLSKHLNAPVLAVLNHDDDVLCYWLFVRGQQTDQYNSDPGYFSGEDSAPEGGNAELLSKTLLVSSDVKTIESILKSREYGTAVERHEDLAQALGISLDYVVLGYSHIDMGDYPPDVSEDDFMHT